jgi:WD40 repeat protein
MLQRLVLRDGRVATVQSEIARGASGVVLRARTEDGAEVAIKLLHRTSAAAFARFEREARLQSSLGEAEGFVPLIEMGTSDEGPFIVMPFLPGTLEDRLAHGPLPLEDAIDTVRILAESMGRAHAAGIVHRDIKPSNILFTPDAAKGGGARPLLADLGLAKHFDVDAPGASRSVMLSGSREMRGTPGYLAPEQARDARAATPAADVFALGATLYQCIAGQPPFVATNLIMVLERAERGDYPPLRSLRPETPPWLASVVDGCLAADPEVRPADGAALAALLAARRGSSGSRALLAGALVLGAVALGLALVLATRRDAPRPSETPAAAPRAPGVLAEPDLPRALQGLRQTGRLHLDAIWGDYTFRHRYGPYHVAVSADERYLISAGLENAWVWDLEQGTQVCAIPGVEGPINAVGLARDESAAITATGWRNPNGLYSGYPGQEPAVFVWELPSGNRLARIPAKDFEVGSTILSNDGARAIVGVKDAVLVFETATGARSAQLPHRGLVRELRLDEKATRLLARSDDETCLYDLESGAVVELLDGNSTAIALSEDGKLVAAGRGDGRVELHEVGNAGWRVASRHRGPVAHVELTTDGRVLSAGYEDRAIWIARTGAAAEPREIPIARPEEPTTADGPLQVAFRPQHGRALVSGWGSTLRGIDLGTGELAPLAEPRSIVMCVAVSPDGKTAACGTIEGTVVAFDAATGKERWHVPAGEHRPGVARAGPPLVFGLGFLPGDDTIVETSWDHRLRSLSVATGADTRTPFEGSNELCSLGISPKGDTILAGVWPEQNGRTAVLSVSSDRVESTGVFWPGASPFLRHLPFLGADGARAIAAVASSELAVVDVATGSRSALLRHADHLNDAAASADGRRVLSSSHLPEALVWDLSGEDPAPRPRRLVGHTGNVMDVLVTPDGKLGVTASWDGTIRLWDLDSGDALAIYRLASASDCAWSLALFPDGRHFLAGTERGVILRFTILP